MYTIKEASARSGVGVPLLRAWERRYGVVAPTRTSAGYRLYDDAAIERLRAMRQLIADGWTAHQAAQRVREISETELAALAQPVVPAETADGVTGASGEGFMDRTAAGALVDRLVAAARLLDAARLEAGAGRGVRLDALRGRRR